MNQNLVRSLQLEDWQKSGLEKLAVSSSLPLAAAVDASRKTVNALRGWFQPAYPADQIASAKAMLSEIAGKDRVSALAPTPVSRKGPGGKTTLFFEYKSGSVPYYGCGAAVTFERNGAISAMTARFPSTLVKPPAANPQPAIDFVRKRMLQEQAHLADVPVPSLEIFDQAALFGDVGEPEPVWVFRFPQAEQPFDVLVSLDGSSLVNVIRSDRRVAGGELSLVEIEPMVRYHLNPATRVPDFVTFGPAGLLLPEAASGSATAVALAFFSAYPAMFGTGDPSRQLQVKEVIVGADPDPMTTVVLQQIIGAFPVWGCELRVHLASTLAIRSISGNYMRDPQVSFTATVGLEAARTTALDDWRAASGRNRVPRSDDIFARASQKARLARRPGDGGDGGAGDGGDGDGGGSEPVDLPAELQDCGLVVLPTALARDGSGANHLAWWFRFPDADRFVSAATGRLVYKVSRYCMARMVLDANHVTDEQLSQEILDGNPPPLQVLDGAILVPQATLDPEALDADNAIGAVEGFWRVFGRNGWDGRGATSIAIVDGVQPGLAAWHDTSLTVTLQGMLVRWPHSIYDRNQAVPDVVAHEFTHGLTQATAGLVYRAESGALNESFSDVFGEIIFPDQSPALPWWAGGTWVHNPAGSNRNLANPAWPLRARYSQYDTGAADFGEVHNNSGIGSHAAVLLCDGNGNATPAHPGTHPGIGRARLARLYWDVLTTRLHPWSTYIDLVHNSWEAARNLVHDGRSGVLVPGGPSPAPQFQQANVDEVLWAFNQVELNLDLASGWYQVPGNTTTDYVFFAGTQVPQGELVDIAEVTVTRRRERDGVPIFVGRARAFNSPTGIQFSGANDPTGMITVNITGHGVNTRNKEIRVTVTTRDFATVEVSANVYTRVVGPPPPVTRHLETATVVHWFDNPLFLGRRYGDIIYEGANLPAGSTVSDVTLELLDNNYHFVASHRFGEPAATWGGTGAWIFARTVGGTGLEVRVRSWHDFGWAVRYRLVFTIAGPADLPNFTIREVGPDNL